MNIHEEWEVLDKRLKKLTKYELEEEEDLLYDAYDNLVLAYQEARDLNRELKQLTLELTQALKESGIAF